VCAVQCAVSMLDAGTCKCLVDVEEAMVECGGGLSAGYVVMLAVLELLVVVLVSAMFFRCWYLNKKASAELRDDEMNLTKQDKNFIGMYDDR